MLKFPSPLSTFSQGSWIHAIYRTSVWCWESLSVKNIHIINNLGGKQHSKWMYISKSKLHFLTYIWELTHYRGNLNMSICHNFNNVESTINEHVDTLQKTGFLQICAFLFSYSFIHGNDAQYGFSFIFHESVWTVLCSVQDYPFFHHLYNTQWSLYS